MNNTGVEREPGWIPDVNSLGARLALVRQAMGWNIAEAATRCGVPIASWRNWENRGKDPRGLINIAIKIAGVTGVDYRWLALGPDRRVESPAAAFGLTVQYGVSSHVVAVGGAPRESFTMRTRPIARLQTAHGAIGLMAGSNASCQ